MNSAQRRKRRRAVAALLAHFAELQERFESEKLEWRCAISNLRRQKEQADAKLRELETYTAHETRKLTENAKRLAPLVAELQIALRQIAQAASILGVDPGHMAVADVASVNELRQKVLAALKGHREN